MTVRMHRDKGGMSGLETAILAISFVLVASVFAYTILSSGLFSSEKESESVYFGMPADQATAELRGSVLAYKGTADSDDCIVKVSFAVSNLLVDGEVIDLTPPYHEEPSGTLRPSDGEAATLISYNDSNTMIDECAWTVEFSAGYEDDGDYLLEAAEKAIITVWLQNYDDATGVWCNGAGDEDPFIDSSSDHLGPNGVFSVQLLPPVGPALLMEKRIPAYLSPVMRLN